MLWIILIMLAGFVVGTLLLALRVDAKIKPMTSSFTGYKAAGLFQRVLAYAIPQAQVLGVVVFFLFTLVFLFWISSGVPSFLTWVVWGVSWLLILPALLTFVIREVPNECWQVLEIFQVYYKTLNPGLNFFPVGAKLQKLKVGDQVEESIFYRQRKLSINDMEVEVSKHNSTDTINIKVPEILVMWRVADARNAIYSVDDVLGTLQSMFKAFFRQVSQDENLDEDSFRKKIEASLAGSLKGFNEDKLQKYGVIIDEVRVADVTLPKDITDASAAKSAAQKEKERIETYRDGIGTVTWKGSDISGAVAGGLAVLENFLSRKG